MKAMGPRFGTKPGAVFGNGRPGLHCSQRGRRLANNNDRRVRRTRHLLEAALLSLLKEKEFDSIAVSEILQRADVGRATFYTHYDNKEDLLESGFDGLLAVLREERRVEPSLAPGQLSFSHHLLAHAHEHRAIFPSLTSEHGGPFLQHVLRRLLLRLVQDELDAPAASHSPSKRWRTCSNASPPPHCSATGRYHRKRMPSSERTPCAPSACWVE